MRFPRTDSSIPRPYAPSVTAFWLNYGKRLTPSQKLRLPESIPGIAHGWAGFLYATLQWCSVSKTALPKDVERRLVELAALALPIARGMDWPWTLGHSGEPLTMPGWCNGACGYVFLWTLAHRLLGDPRYLELAQGAAWRSWDAPEQIVTLCCGLAGRAYALLNSVPSHQRDRMA